MCIRDRSRDVQISSQLRLMSTTHIARVAFLPHLSGTGLGGFRAAYRGAVSLPRPGVAMRTSTMRVCCDGFGRAGSVQAVSQATLVVFSSQGVEACHTISVVISALHHRQFPTPSRPNLAFLPSAQQSHRPLCYISITCVSVYFIFMTTG